jgi:hypothetical protein
MLSFDALSGSANRSLGRVFIIQILAAGPHSFG